MAGGDARVLGVDAAVFERVIDPRMIAVHLARRQSWLRSQITLFRE